MIPPMRWVARFTLFVLLLSAPAHAQAPPLQGLDAYVAGTMRDWQVPGLAIGVVKDDVLVFAKGYGVRELGKTAQVDELTLFAVASNSKAFTAALLGILVAEGKLGWDDRVTDHLRNFQLYDPFVTRDIRVRDLLTHRSGLPEFGGDHLWIGDARSSDDILRRLRYLQPSAPFRAKYQYQNLMFLAAGQIIPALTGESWNQTLENRIFKPLGMTDSFATAEERESKENVATPHEIVEGKLVPIAYDNVDNVAPAGAINSNVVEMAQWMRLNLAGGVYDGKEILPSRVVREMQSIHMSMPLSDVDREIIGIKFQGYGLGWRMFDYRGHKVVSHGGGLSGMISRIWG
jgi:CubicO group peptidase (beta-lactamase class C family)